MNIKEVFTNEVRDKLNAERTLKLKRDTSIAGASKGVENLRETVEEMRQFLPDLRFNVEEHNGDPSYLTVYIRTPRKEVRLDVYGRYNKAGDERAGTYYEEDTYCIHRNGNYVSEKSHGLYEKLFEEIIKEFVKAHDDIQLR